MAITQGADRRIVGVNWGVGERLLGLYYRFFTNVPTTLPFVNMQFYTDGYQVLSPSIAVLAPHTPPYVEPPLVHPISDAMMERLFMFTAKDATKFEFTPNPAWEGIVYTEVRQSGAIFFNMGKIKSYLATLPNKPTKFYIEADVPIVDGYYSADHVAISSFGANVYANTDAEAFQQAMEGLESLDGFVSLISYNGYRHLVEMTPMQYYVRGTYYFTPQVAKNMYWEATAYQWVTKTRTLQFDDLSYGMLYANDEVEPAPNVFSKVYKQAWQPASFTSKHDRFLFTVDTKTFKVT
jgi:hypothetical protein